MLKNTVFLLILLSKVCFLHAQNPPSIGLIDDDTIIVNSGENIILLPEINDGDTGINQDITFTVTSTDEDVLLIDRVEYNINETFAVLYVIEQGSLGTSTIEVTMDDGDGTDNASMNITSTTYDMPGINMFLYDKMFWRGYVTDDDIPVWDSIIMQVDAPFGAINFNAIDGLSNGEEFFQTKLEGYIVPPSTGSYQFSIGCRDEHARVELSTDHTWENLAGILDDQTDALPSDDSELISLQAGKAYAFRVLHQEVVWGQCISVEWTGPTLTKQTINGTHIMPIYDTVCPSVPKNLKIIAKGDEFLRIGWEASNDNNELTGYSIYVNGRLNNPMPVKDTAYIITGLSPSTKYSVVVRSLDRMGNKSLPSNIVTTTTYPQDNISPSPPTSLTTLVQSGLALKVAWKGQEDEETDVVAFNLYIDGILYNTEDYIWDTTTILKILEPKTEYDITLEAIDAGENISSISSIFTVSTSEYDLNGQSLGIKKGRLKIRMENLSWNQGIGINPNYRTTDLFSIYKPLLEDMHTGAVRWGALTANSLSFSQNINTDSSIAAFINLCNELDAYTSFSCGVSSTTDWRTNPQTFLDFLEYINGPPGTIYGDIRETEGYGPLFEQSKGLIFEFGSEVWGFGAHNADFNDYEEYGNWCRDMAAIMRTSPYWNEDKITLVYSGRKPHPNDNFGLHNDLMMGDTGDIDWLAVSGYLRPDKSYNTNLEYYKNTIASAARNMEGLKLTIKDMLIASGEIKNIFFYEGNMTTSSYNGRLGQAIICTNYYLSALKRGAALPSLFHLTGGKWRITKPLDGYSPYPLFITAKYFNKYCKGHVLKTNYNTQNTITDSDGIIINWNPVGCYAYTDSSNYCLVLLSRDFENSHYVQVDLPDDFVFDSSSGKKYIISGNSFDAFNATTDSSSFSMNDSLIFEVPPFSMVLVTFTGDDQNFEYLPLGDFHDYVKADSLAITCIEGTKKITSNNGRLHFTANIYPDSVFADQVIWDILDNDIGALFLEGILVAPTSGTGLDTICIKATSGDRQVFDTVMVIIDLEIPTDDAIFTIKDINENPVQGATVELTGYGQRTTDTSGIATFTDVNAENNMQFTVTASGYQQKTGYIDMPDDADVHTYVTLTKIFDVTFNITDAESSSPIQNAEVTLTGYDTLYTNASGQVIFSDITEAMGISYSINASGYPLFSGNIDITGSDVIKNIKLSTTGQTYYSVTFTVMNDSSQYINDAYVELEGYGTKTTDNNGETLFEDVAPDNNLNYTVTAADYQKSTGSINVTDQDIEKQIILSASPPGTYNVTFEVTNKQFNPLNDATVNLAIYGSKKTASNGKAVFTSISPANDIAYAITKPGFKNHVNTIDLIDQDINKPIQLESGSYSITFVVTNQNDIAIEGASVNLLGEGTQTTNASGQTVFSNVLSGSNLTYIVTSPEHATITDTIASFTNDMIETVKIRYVGIEKIANNEIKIFPNPVNNILHIENINAVKRISIKNITGQIIRDFEMNGQNKVEITTKDMEQGCYIISFKGNNNYIEVKKIIKY